MEHGHRDEEEKKMPPLVEAALKAPLSLINLITMVVLGMSFWFGTQSDLQRLADKVVNQDQRITELKEKVTANELATTQNLAILQRDMTDVKATTRGIEASLQILISQLPRTSQQ